MHKASVMSVNAEANVRGADWLMSIFVNELAPPHMYAVNKVIWSMREAVLKDYERHFNCKGIIIF